MRTFVTGSSGLVGAQVAADLATGGHEVVSYDLVDGRDILDSDALFEAARGCDTVVHSAALLGDPGESDDEILAVNVQGTWNVLSAARHAGVGRVVFLSSVDVLGVFKGERAPDYLPLNDAHPRYATTPYGISKCLAEDMCRAFSADAGIPVIALRPPGVWSRETYDRILAARAKRAEYEWDPFWEYGAFIDVRDLSRACILALTCEVEGYACLLVTSADITTSGRTSRELAEFVMPDVEWRGDAAYEDEWFRSLVDIEPARRVLRWSPGHTWRAHVARLA
jgi:UDP-glucose 4-epimerase